MLRFEKNFNETAEYYALETDDGLIMNLGVNPLLQIGLDETRSDYEYPECHSVGEWCAL